MNIPTYVITMIGESLSEQLAQECINSAKQFGIESIPSTFLLDKGNKIAAYNLRGEALSQKVKELLNE